MLGFNATEFLAINGACSGVSEAHKHDGWGLLRKPHKAGKHFATAMETAYPMPKSPTKT